jgi:hypothetical protein
VIRRNLDNYINIVRQLVAWWDVVIAHDFKSVNVMVPRGGLNLTGAEYSYLLKNWPVA